MENRFFTISSEKNPIIKAHVATGHFTTSSSHISHYIDVSDLKSNIMMAKDAAQELSIPYRASTLIDMIVCMDGTEIIAAYLADELFQDGTLIMNEGETIHVVTPMSAANGQMLFHQNMQKKISGGNILLLVASVSTGKTIRRAMECISYYGGEIVGISAIFSAVPDVEEREIHALLSREDIPDYRFYRSTECELCKEGHKLDAIISSEGYTKI